VWDELRSLSPMHGGMSYRRLEDLGGIQWPCVDEQDPGATFLRSFDAGQGQRYYLFGSTASFAEVVKYYRTQLKDGGDLVYDIPPVHMFEVGRFREETMAFPPGVTVKDYTGGTAKGYVVPTPGANPSRFPTVIQFVPVLPANK